MPVEFALRPRIRLREAPAPARRVRARLPKFALPALGYWLLIGGLVYEFVSHHDPNSLPAESEAALAPLPTVSPAAARPWWRPLPARPAPEPPPPVAPALPEPAAAEPELGVPAAEPPVAELTAPELSTDDLSDLEAPPAPLATEAPLAADAPLAANLRARRRARASERMLPLPTPTPERAPVRDPASNNVGVPAAPLVFAPLDEPLPAHALEPAPAPTPTEPPRSPGASGLPSCESAIASASQDVDFSGGNRTADLPTQAIAAVLENGAWLSSCNVPERTSLDVCVAIKGGRVVGASISSRPADAALNQCVKRRASSLQFPYSPHLDVARTRF
ncbi:MAG TPA: hypothetical protein VHM25_16200 [Polyangiaceae bacterium]|jgi:hypothetical protein|nr:hypothetical protein [Polyangiaceae bacterium]